MNKLLLFTFVLFINSISWAGSGFNMLPPPVNDLCENAIPIVCDELLAGDTTESTDTGDPVAVCGTGPGAPGNWYQFTGTGDLVTF